MTEVVALHGFLGLPSDWQHFDRVAKIHAVDLWQGIDRLPTENAFDLWAERFEPVGEKPVLLGYSMGGRLAMHLASKRPELFSGVMIVSANPGLVNESEKPARLANDLQWAERFRSEPWETVIGAWNAQPVLRTPPGAMQLPRNESDFDRNALARALDIWSLARQRDLRRSIANLPIPALFVSGEKDTKFDQLMRGLELPKRSEYRAVAGAGHRVPWDRPDEFAGLLARFLRDR